MSKLYGMEIESNQQKMGSFLALRDKLQAGGVKVMLTGSLALMLQGALAEVPAGDVDVVVATEDEAKVVELLRASLGGLYTDDSEYAEDTIVGRYSDGVTDTHIIKRPHILPNDLPSWISWAGSVDSYMLEDINIYISKILPIMVAKLEYIMNDGQPKHWKVVSDWLNTLKP